MYALLAVKMLLAWGLAEFVLFPSPAAKRPFWSWLGWVVVLTVGSLVALASAPVAGSSALEGMLMSYVALHGAARAWHMRFFPERGARASYWAWSFHVALILFFATGFADEAPRWQREWTYVVAGLFFVTLPAGRLIGLLLSGWQDLLEEEWARSLPQAGMWIGLLERVLVFVFVLLNHWEGVGFLIAAKSVFRFGDLHRNEPARRLTEYVLIGTLCSFSLAGAVGLMVKHLLGW